MKVFAAFLVFTAWFSAGSLISDSMRFPYGYISAGSLVLFLLAGLLLFSSLTPFRAGLATGTAALLASLAAWAILAMLNPVQAPVPEPSLRAVAEVAVLMGLAALLLGAAGGWLASRRARA